MSKLIRSSQRSGLSTRPLFLTAALIVIAAAVWYISGHWFQLMLITGDSMKPAYHSGQFVLIDRRTHSFQTGDVIAFRCENLHAVLVKRIAACPGDTVEIRDGHLQVNGCLSSLYDDLFETAGILGEKTELEAGCFTVLGDNIAESSDSRDARIGIVQEKDIIGKLIPQKQSR